MAIDACKNGAEQSIVGTSSMSATGLHAKGVLWVLGGATEYPGYSSWLPRGPHRLSVTERHGAALARQVAPRGNRYTGSTMQYHECRRSAVPASKR